MLPDLSQYRLCLPVNAAGAFSFQHDAAIISPPQLLTYSSEWFHRDGAELVFKCPDGGAYSATATHARSELRDLRDFTIHDHVRTDLTLAVMHLGEGEKVIVRQIHDGAEEWVKLVYRHFAAGGKLYAMITKQDGATDLHVPLLSGLKLGDWIDTSIEFIPVQPQLGQKSQHLKVAATCGTQTALVNTPMNRTGDSAAYWKLGAYYIVDDRKYAAGDHNAYCEVRHR